MKRWVQLEGGREGVWEKGMVVGGGYIRKIKNVGPKVAERKGVCV